MLRRGRPGPDSAASSGADFFSASDAQTHERRGERRGKSRSWSWERREGKEGGVSGAPGAAERQLLVGEVREDAAAASGPDCGFKETADQRGDVDLRGPSLRFHHYLQVGSYLIDQ